MLWLSNVLAYSLQLAILVGAAMGIAALLRIDRPVAALRFWQSVFAATLLWPAVQVWGPTVAGRGTPEAHVLDSVAEWAMFASAGEPAEGTPAVVLIAVIAAGAGALFRLSRIALGMRGLQIIRDQSVPALSLAAIARELQNDLGTDADIRFTARVTSPATYGVTRPTVLLPLCVEQLAPDVQQAILCHELMHVARRDWVATIVEEVWCAVLWFHPAARALAGQLAYVRETVVDQATMARTGNRRAYAAALLAFAGAGPPVAATAALIGRRFEDRIALISQEGRMNRTALRLRICVAASTVAAATLAMTMVAPLSLTVGAQEQRVYKSDEGVTLPRVITEVKPVYTPGAMRAKIQGAVWMKAVVLADGTVDHVTVEKSLDREHGLDEQAVRALTQWTFEPGTKDGEAVSVEVTVKMTFTLKK
jgi:TonB family protein